jgi:hypothetical protein
LHKTNPPKVSNAMDFILKKITEQKYLTVHNKNNAIRNGEMAKTGDTLYH